MASSGCDTDRVRGWFSSRVRRWYRADGRRAALVVLSILSGSGGLGAQEFHVDTGARRVVRFVSRAPIEDFEGVTERIDGFVVVPAGGLKTGLMADGSEFYFEVDLASLDTGIGLRNRHMRESYLETDAYPYATYSGRVVRVDAVAGGSFRATVAGELEIHGIRRPLDIPCDLTPEGTGYRVGCAWSVKLSEHDVRIPRLMFMKINEEIRLEVDFAVRPAGDPGP